MRKAKKDLLAKQSFKKELKKQIAFQLTNHLGELKSILGDKKFEARVRKASKLLSSGVKKQETDGSEKTKKKSTAKPKAEKTPPITENSQN